MHKQIRSEPTKSPADVGAFLQTLADAGVNIVAVGGGAIEHGGKVVIACHLGDRDDTDAALRTLDSEAYPHEVVNEGMNPSGYLHVGAMRDREGELAREVRAALAGAGAGYIVEDVALGVPFSEDGALVFPVQIFCVRSTGSESAAVI